MVLECEWNSLHPEYLFYKLILCKDVYASLFLKKYKLFIKMNQILIVVDVEYHLHDVCWFMSIDTHFRHKLYELSITFKNNWSLMIWVWWQRKHKTIFKDVINIHFYIIQPNRNISNHIEEGNHIWILLAVTLLYYVQ